VAVSAAENKNVLCGLVELRFGSQIYRINDYIVYTVQSIPSVLACHRAGCLAGQLTRKCSWDNVDSLYWHVATRRVFSPAIRSPFFSPAFSNLAFSAPPYNIAVLSCGT